MSRADRAVYLPIYPTYLVGTYLKTFMKKNALNRIGRSSFYSPHELQNHRNKQNPTLQNGFGI